MGYYIGDFVRIRPRFEIDQEKLLHWTARIHALAAERAELSEFSCIKRRLLQLGSGSDRIQNRGVQLTDPFEESCENMQIYPVTLHPEGVGFTERMDFFDREATAIFEQFYPPGAPLPSHLIHVTCTGYVAPSPAQKIVSKRNALHCFVTHAYHMGCYAAMPAIRIAQGSLSLPTPDSSVDIVHTEICSLHMHPLRNSTEQLIVQSLFADGFIKYSLYKESDRPDSLQILSVLQEIIPDSVDSMTWRCEDICHSMTLAKEVPVYITRALNGYLSRLIQLAGLDENTIKGRAYFAIHPGGPKILQYIQQHLHLQDTQLAHSLYVLQNYGNMSSATLPHIWENMLNDDQVPPGSHIVSLAFGPGLSLTGALFQKSG